MKTPRELLLERHRPTAAKLDRVRANALSTAFARETRAMPQNGHAETGVLIRTVIKVWQELIWPCRFAWTGMAALWIVVLTINLSLSDSRATSQSARSSPTPAMLQAVEERRRLLAELIQPSVAPEAPSPPHNVRPRSERREEIRMT
jgi:hypothetical protein